MKERALNRSNEVKNKYRISSSKPIIIYNKDESLYATFSSIGDMMIHFKCDSRTIRKSIKNNSLFRHQYIVKLGHI
jgi:hypothetical protein